MLVAHWSRLRFLLAVSPCDRAVDSFPKWYDTWKLAKKWWRESQFFNLVIFLTNTKKFKNPWLGAPGPFFGLFQWCQGMFLKVPEGFQRKKFSSCADTKLVPICKSGFLSGVSVRFTVFKSQFKIFTWWSTSPAFPCRRCNKCRKVHLAQESNPRVM